MRDEVNMAVQSVKTVNDSLERSQKTAVQLLIPMGRYDNMRGAVESQTVGEVIDFGVRDVPPLLHGKTTPPSGTGRHHLQGSPNPHHAMNRPLTVFARCLQKALDAAQAKNRFSLATVAHRTRNPKRLTPRQTAVALIDRARTSGRSQATIKSAVVPSRRNAANKRTWAGWSRTQQVRMHGRRGQHSQGIAWEKLMGGIDKP